MKLTLGDMIAERVPEGWRWCLYSECSTYRARAVLISPDYKVQIGREAETIDEALRLAVAAVRRGEKV